MAKRKRTITAAERKKAFRTLAEWIAADDKRLKSFSRALRRSASTKILKNDSKEQS